MPRDEIERIRNLFIGLEKKVYVEGKGKIQTINFDNAATTPVLKRVMKKILDESELYSSIARGDGQKSIYCSDYYEECREFILNYFNAPSRKYTALFIGNTTEGINRLSRILIKDINDVVIATRMEHHSNDLPWRGKCDLKYAEVDDKGRVKIDELEYILKNNKGKVKYVTITGASNVTGYINDIRKVAKLAHKYGAKIIVDAAQLVAHKKIVMLGMTEEEDIDFLVFSAHKMYAPFGGGVIIGLKEAFNNCKPDMKGGGTVYMVRDYGETLLETPERNEPGSPNYFGAITIIEALKTIDTIGFKAIEEREKEMLKYLIEGMKKIENVILYGDNENYEDRLGIVVFNIKGINYEDVGEALANNRAIAVRQGGFCAHPYVRRLLKIEDKDLDKYIAIYGVPGMVRVSLGMYNSKKEIDIFLDTIEMLASKVK